MTNEKLNEVLEKHKLWLANKEGGEYADLRGADLCDANLHGADLCISKGTAWARDKCPLDIKLGELFLLCQRKGIDISEFVGGELKLKGADRP